MTEKEFLQNYDINQFDRPSIATDMAVFSIEEQDNKGNYRKDPENVLKLLLIKRDEYPFKEKWALPGGFLRKDEEPKSAAFRELKEETGVDGAFLRTLDVFGTPNRDPRGWIISHAYLALIDSTKCDIKAGADAERAEWFEVSVKEESEEFSNDENSIIKEYIYRVRLVNDNEEIVSCRVRRCVRYEKFHEMNEYEIIENDGLAFDHPEIILRAYLELRDMVEKDGRIIFDLLPEYFTMYKLQKSFEIILGKELLVANFRRKMSDFVIETDKIDSGSGHRPAKMYIRNLEMF